MAVALRDLDRGRRSPDLRLIHAPPRPPTPRAVFWLRRALVVLMAVIAVVAATAGVRAASGAGIPQDTAGLEMTVVLPAGQTLWDLAGRYAPDGRDRATWVQEVAARNELDPGAILPGTPVLIPIESAAITADPLLH